MEAWTRLHKWPQAPLPPGHCRPHLSCGTTPPPQTVGFSPCSYLSTSPWTSKSWASEPQLAPSWCLLTPPSLSRSPCICCQLPSSPRVPPQIPEMGLMQNGSSWHPVPVGKKFAPQGSLPMLAGPFLVSPCCPTVGRGVVGRVDGHHVMASVANPGLWAGSWAWRLATPPVPTYNPTCRLEAGREDVSQTRCRTGAQWGLLNMKLIFHHSKCLSVDCKAEYQALSFQLTFLTSQSHCTAL